MATQRKRRVAWSFTLSGETLDRCMYSLRIRGAYSSAGRAFGSHPKGRRFEPCYAQREKGQRMLSPFSLGFTVREFAPRTIRVARYWSNSKQLGWYSRVAALLRGSMPSAIIDPLASGF